MTVRDAPAPAFVRHASHPSGYVIDQVAQSAISMRHALVLEPGLPRKLGAQTREILTELGLSREDVEALIQDGTARETWGEQYLPD